VLSCAKLLRLHTPVRMGRGFRSWQARGKRGVPPDQHRPSRRASVHARPVSGLSSRSSPAPADRLPVPLRGRSGSCDPLDLDYRCGGSAGFGRIRTGLPVLTVAAHAVTVCAPHALQRTPHAAGSVPAGPIRRQGQHTRRARGMIAGHDGRPRIRPMAAPTDHRRAARGVRAARLSRHGPVHRPAGVGGNSGVRQLARVPVAARQVPRTHHGRRAVDDGRSDRGGHRTAGVARRGAARRARPHLARDSDAARRRRAAAPCGAAAAVVYGLVLAALVQGVLVGLGYWLAGTGAPVFLAALTTVSGLIPFAAPTIWGCVVAWLLLKGSTVAGVGLLIWGSVVMSWTDHIVRPFLISREAEIHFLVVMFGVLGGLAAFGLVGLF